MLSPSPTTVKFFGSRNRDVRSALKFIVAAAVSAAEGRSFDGAGNEKFSCLHDRRTLARSFAGAQDGGLELGERVRQNFCHVLWMVAGQFGDLVAAACP